jgi:formylglycine-generating enzyme required for sulfatase activity
MQKQNISFRINNTLFEFIFVQGTPDNEPFMMGSNQYNSEKPIHPVSIPDFWIAKTPTTQAQWKAIMGEENNPSYFEGDTRPVECVSWDKIMQEFLPHINEKLVDLQLPYKCKLPSEAKWEYAARGGVYWKEMLRFSGSSRLEEVGWSNRNSNDETKPVCLKAPNQLGIYDMSGNVWEWCEDEWHENYEGTPKKGDRLIDEKKNPKRIVPCGGSWLNLDDDCRSSIHHVILSNLYIIAIGFRLELFAFEDL